MQGQLAEIYLYHMPCFCKEKPYKTGSIKDKF